MFTDEEVFGNEEQPNIIQAGEVELTVDWEVTYFGAGPSPTTLARQDEPVNRPGPIVDIVDLKPGDIVEKTLSAHVGGNPGFLTFDLTVLADEDNGINNPEDAVDGTFDGGDGTAGGDLAEHTNCVIWYDGFVDDGGVGGGAGSLPGNNRPDEGIWVAAGDPTDDDDFEAALDKAESPSDAFDTASDLVIASGTLADLSDTSNPILIDSRNQGDTAEDFSGTACYDDGTVQYLGCVCWLPRNVAGVDDNILQTDRLEYQFGLAAVQCRDNVDDDGIPISPEVASGPGEGDVDG